MNAEQCHARAAECAANAALSTIESVTLEFLKLAAQWRAMAVRDIFLGFVQERIDEPAVLTAPPSCADLQ
ncbi:MAG TPA: hypothetical protein VN805_15895 [Caulobacteraceae bacterium]|nr:hypothetical protein [Caulobacteraceae bacterium]